MAAVFAFIFLFGLAAAGLFYKVAVGSATIVSVSALVIFVAMATGIFIGCFKMMKGWEGPETH